MGRLLFKIAWRYCENYAYKHWDSYCYLAKKNRLAVFCDREEYGLFLAFSESIKKFEETIQ